MPQVNLWWWLQSNVLFHPVPMAVISWAQHLVTRTTSGGVPSSYGFDGPLWPCTNRCGSEVGLLYDTVTGRKAFAHPFFVQQLGAWGESLKSEMREPHGKSEHWWLRNDQTSTGITGVDIYKRPHTEALLEPRLGWRDSGPVPKVDF